ncbi:MAG TPA: hypothetical protein VGD42_13480 [Lysobacter sp.]
MNSRMMKSAVNLALVASLVAGTALASADKAAMILQQQREIREASESSTGAYARFGREALTRMHEAQDKVFDLLGGGKSVEDLRPDQQVELFNSLEEVKAILAQNDRNRQKCWREHKLGTTMKITRCATLAELEQVRRDSEQWKGEPTICGQRDAMTDCGGNVRMGFGQNR